MLQASVTYNTTEYSNSTIENVSAPLSGKYGQVIMFVESPISSRTLSVEDLPWPVLKWQNCMTFLVLPLHSWFQYWAIRRFKIDPWSNSASTFQSTWRYFCQSRYLSSRWVLRVPFPAQDIIDQLCNHKFSTIFLDISVVIPAIVGTILALLVILVLVSSTDIYGFCFNNHFRSHMLLVVDEQESPTKKSKLLLWSFHQAASEFIKITHLHTMLSIRDRQTWSADLPVFSPTLQPFQQFVNTSFQ